MDTQSSEYTLSDSQQLSLAVGAALQIWQKYRAHIDAMERQLLANKSEHLAEWLLAWCIEMTRRLEISLRARICLGVPTPDDPVEYGQCQVELMQYTHYDYLGTTLLPAIVALPPTTERNKFAVRVYIHLKRHDLPMMIAMEGLGNSSELWRSTSLAMMSGWARANLSLTISTGKGQGQPNRLHRVLAAEASRVGKQTELLLREILPASTISVLAYRKGQMWRSEEVRNAIGRELVRAGPLRGDAFEDRDADLLPEKTLDDAEARLEAQQEAMHILDAAGLTARQKTVYVRSEAYEFKDAEIAEQLGIAIGTVAATLSQARKKIRA